MNKSKAIKNIILMTKLDDESEKKVKGSLTEICRLYRFNYNTLIRKSYPFDHDGWRFEKLPFRED